MNQPKHSEAIDKIISSGTLHERAQLAAFATIRIYDHLTETGHKRDLLIALVDYLLTAGMVNFVNIVRKVDEAQNAQRDHKVLAMTFILAAEQGFDTLQEKSLRLYNLTDVLSKEIQL